MGMYYNNGAIRTPKQIWYNSPSVGLKKVKEAYWNVNGTVKRVWPEQAYLNGNFGGELSGGVITRISVGRTDIKSSNPDQAWSWKNFWTYIDDNTQCLSDRAVYSQDMHDGYVDWRPKIENLKITSGDLPFYYQQWSSGGTQPEAIGYQSIDDIDMNSVKNITIAFSKDENHSNNAWVRTFFVAVIKNSQVISWSLNPNYWNVYDTYNTRLLENTDHLIDCTGVNGVGKVAFGMQLMRKTTTGWQTSRYTGKITKIKFNY